MPALRRRWRRGDRGGSCRLLMSRLELNSYCCAWYQAPCYRSNYKSSRSSKLVQQQRSTSHLGQEVQLSMLALGSCRL